MPSAASSAKTRDKWISSAQHFLGAGDVDVSVHQLAKHSGLSVGSLYAHFGDKRELFAAAVAEAVLAELPAQHKLLALFDDPGLGVLAVALVTCNRPLYAPETARMMLEVGFLGFSELSEYFEPLTRALQTSVDRGFAQCEDVEAFVVACSGAYQHVIARVYNGTASVDLAERVIWLFAQQLGYSRAEFDEVKSALAKNTLFTQ